MVISFVFHQGKSLDKKIHWLKVGKHGTCEQIPDVAVNKKKPKDDCEQQFKNLLSYIAALDAPVIVANRWTFKLYPITNQNIKIFNKAMI